MKEELSECLNIDFSLYEEVMHMVMFIEKNKYYTNKMKERLVQIKKAYATFKIKQISCFGNPLINREIRHVHINP